jgi:hypothetical protein
MENERRRWLVRDKRRWTLRETDTESNLSPREANSKSALCV